MNTNHFDYFIAIAGTGSLSMASRRLGVSQPVLSRYLSNLENSLDTCLFFRDSHQFHITQSGRIYLNGIMRMKELQTQMLRSMNTLRGVQTQDLSIGMSPYRGGQELAAFYPGLLSRYPNLNLRVTEDNASGLMEKLYHKELSAIINLYDPDLMPDTKAATLIKTELLLVLPSYHSLCSNCETDENGIGFLTAEQFCSLNDVLFISAGEDSVIGQIIDSICLRYHFSPQSLLRTSNAIAISSLIASGSYAGFRLQNTLSKQTNIRYFHLPHPSYLYSGMIFLNDHQPTEMEQYLYYLEYLQAMQDTPHILYVNPFGQQLINTVLENIERN